jgi:gas vesicle protein
MSDANDPMESARHEQAAGDHRLAVGIMIGTTLGVGLGLLLAPRTGSELRGQIKAQATRAAHTCANGYHAATGKAAALGHRCHDAYDSSRHHVADAYRGTARYIGELTDAVTMKARRQSGAARRLALTQPPSPAGDPEGLRLAPAGSLESRNAPGERSMSSAL